MNAAIDDDERGEAARRKEFRQVMASVTRRAWVRGLEDEVMAALYDILNDGVDIGAAAVYAYSPDAEDELA